MLNKQNSEDGFYLHLCGCVIFESSASGFCTCIRQFWAGHGMPTNFAGVVCAMRCPLAADAHLMLLLLLVAWEGNRSSGSV